MRAIVNHDKTAVDRQGIRRYNVEMTITLIIGRVIGTIDENVRKLLNFNEKYEIYEPAAARINIRVQNREIKKSKTKLTCVVAVGKRAVKQADDLCGRVHDRVV